METLHTERDREQTVLLAPLPFIQWIHHELRQSTTAAGGYVALLTSDEWSLTSAEQKELSRALERHIVHMADIRLAIDQWLQQKEEQQEVD